MRFYISIDEISLELKIMSFWDKHIDGDETIIPEDGSLQTTIYFPIPKNLKAKCTKFLNILTEGYSVNDLFELPVQKRPDKMKEIRKEFNPKIVEKLYEFRDLNAEDFL